MDGVLVTKRVVSYCQRRCNAVFAIHSTVKVFNRLYITDMMERFGFKSEHAMQVMKLIKGL